jgi:IS30 family transposase
MERKIVDEKRSPAAILGEIERDNLQFQTRICVATLYSYIRKEVFATVRMTHLPEGGKRKQKKEHVTAKSAPRGESIEKRPEEANTREVFGHWEGDTVKGKQGTKETLFVLTERKTRDEKIIPIPNGKAESVVAAIDGLEQKLGAAFPLVFKSITFDNGSENADSKGIERSIFGGQRTATYYCHPYSSCERGSNENQNKHIRRFIPKGVPLADYTPEQVAEVERWLNTNPRKIHGWRTAEQLFQTELASIGVEINDW